MQGHDEVVDRRATPRQVWLTLRQRENLDELPERLCPKDGCPRCGSAYVSFTSLLMPGGASYGVLNDRGRVLGIVEGSIAAALAVRLVCHEGDVVEYDGERLSVVWWTTSIGLMSLRAIRSGAVRTTNEPGLRKRLRSEVCPPPSCCAAAFDVSEGRC